MPHVLDLIRQHGDLFYLITFVWTALEGETFVIFAALAAQRGFLNIEALFFAAWAGSFCGDQVFFWLGRRFGTRIVAHMPKIQPKLEKVFGWLEKYATAFVLSYRFMYGIRNVSSIAIGISHLPWRRFIVLNAVAAFIWAIVFCGSGYLFGDVIARLGKHKEEIVDYGVRNMMLSVLGLFAVIVVIKLGLYLWQRRREAGKNGKV